MRNLAFFIAVISSNLVGCKAGNEGLAAIHADIVTDYKNVAQLSPEDYLKRDKTNVLLLDIREPEEYAVSRIPGAVWVNPNASAETALIQMGDVRGKEIIVYCSVGRRSSAFAEREQAALMDMGAASVSNLENGIFGWHNERRELEDAGGKTDVVHPFNGVWKRYVKRDEKARYTPLSKK
jgi:rhodanese-related sulfurtransferase